MAVAGERQDRAPAGGKTPRPAKDRQDRNAAEIARAILARELRPRVADIRCLAEAVLAQQEGLRQAPVQPEEVEPTKARPNKAKPANDKKADKPDAAAKKKKKKRGGKKRKLAKIPGQTSKK
ncbi:hypothetical protein AEB_P1078 [Altererythrobacter sp. B11]|uniref:hypothetical protein n=1 Tax=Altererythrobacter sp. B11 TaxID=2060312 RepID=UPI000DC6DDFF|nr:hypothetical protein [Altererythrobacter sp. B11]BBC71946.1 hypothetical protein AEB_P1078 [Altererythrobacter sp. B11]